MELDQVAGSVEDDIADIIAHAREKELLLETSIPACRLWSDVAVQICSQPKLYKVDLPTFAPIAIRN